MAFYVPLGPRGLLFRLGTLVIGIWGGLVYRLAYRRRTIVISNPEPFPTGLLLGVHAYGSIKLVPTMAGTFVQGSLASDSEAAAPVGKQTRPSSSRNR